MSALDGETEHVAGGEGRLTQYRRVAARAAVVMAAVLLAGPGDGYSPPPAPPPAKLCGSAPVQSGSVRPHLAPTPFAAAGIEHIFVLVQQNASFRQIIGSPYAPYTNALARECGVAANYLAVRPNTAPAMIGGSQFGNRDLINAPNLTTLMTSSGRTWKSYEEDLPYPCFKGAAHDDYVLRHDPFLRFQNVRRQPRLCRRVVPFDQLAVDLKSDSTTPNLVWLTANLKHDMHDGGEQERITRGDRWMSSTLNSVFASPAWRQGHSLLIVTWDENKVSHIDQVPALLVGPNIRAGFRSHRRYNHYSLLRTIEDAFGLTQLTRNDRSAQPMNDFLVLPGH
jgi:hypothetical protein